MKIKIRDIATAGLPAEGKYRMRVTSVGSDKGISKNGYEWERADVTFRLTEDEEGNELKNQPFVFDKFFVSGKELERFLKLYEAVTGYLPEEGDVDPETGEPAVDTDDLLQDLVDRDVYGVVLYDTNTTTGRYGLRTGWSFAQSFDKVRMPRKRTE